jgi:hypothetical protein
MGIATGAVLGGLFFLWISGTRVIDPSQFEWLMKLDWRINFLGWHLFRNDPWRIPPGVIEGYLAGEGTTIGFTDSIPLAALALKPFDPWLPTPFQYFGSWLLGCFVLQGSFGALITRVWTPSALVQAAGAALFVVVPTLLMRVGHPALTAHFLLLWALWLHLAPRVPHPVSSHMALGLCAGLTHPYLAAMTLAILLATPLRDRTRKAMLLFGAACVATISGWWLGGFISVSNAADLSAGGLGLYSMNLLSPITPRGWSTMLPDVPVAHELQAYEGFQYLGAGMLLLLAVALSVLLAHRRLVAWRVAAPVTVVCLICALYAVSPRMTLGAATVIDVTNPLLDRLAFFRATGRFFWPMTYLLITGSIALVVARFRHRTAFALLLVAVTLQVADQRNAHAERRMTSRSDAFHTWPRQLLSPAWGELLAHYDHIVIVPATQCGGAPIAHEELAYLAGLHGLTVNSGLGARWDESKRRRYCGSLEVAVAKGTIDDRSVYLLSAAHEQQLKRSSGGSVVCGQLDGARLCVTGASARAWRDKVRLSD